MDRELNLFLVSRPIFCHAFTQLWLDGPSYESKPEGAGDVRMVLYGARWPVRKRDRYLLGRRRPAESSTF